MVIDRETNKVFFSELLSTDTRFASTYNGICSILDKHQIEHETIKDTKDIWCRDYMPIQKSQFELIQFRYEPSYLKDDLHLQTNPVETLKSNDLKATFSDINLDGGNVIRWSDRVIITERVFTENPNYSNRSILLKELEELFEAEVIIIPEIKSDMTGHADGLVRFYDRTTLIGNSLEDEYAYWSTGMRRVLANYNLNYIDIPFMDYKVKGFPYSAIGCYVNYLEVEDLIIVPVFEVEDNKDEEAVRLLSESFSNRIIETITINEIAKYGGLLNCISWNIRTD
jgi:agmatine deiminase